MTSPEMGRRYIEEARGRVELVRLAFDRKLWSTVVREAQECKALRELDEVAAVCGRLLEDLRNASISDTGTVEAADRPSSPDSDQSGGDESV